MPSILLVEDNAITRKLVRFALEQQGYAVIEAATGQAALAAAETSEPDLVLQDLKLPDMDGFELGLQLRAAMRPRVPILAFSGFVSQSEGARIAAAGFDDIIVKPVEPSRLLQIVRAYLSVASDPFGKGLLLLLLADDDPLQAKARLLGQHHRRPVGQAPLLSPDGQRRGGVSVFRDVTIEKATQEQLMVSDRMASVGTLAAGVAHEINNPLGSVMANLHLLGQGLAAVEKSSGRSLALDEMTDELADATESAVRIRNIVRDLKIFSRSEVEVTGPVDVTHVLESTLRMAWNEIRHRARLVKLHGKIVPVEASESRLGQVLLNLVVNAAQAIPEGRAESNEIRVATRMGDDGLVIIEIEDSGSGMPPEVLGRLFTPFFTTKQVGVGTGLGLSICHRIVSGFGGSITVESAVGKGTLFRVALPPARAAEPTPAAPAVLVTTAARRRGKVLVVDDEPMIAHSVQRTLAAEYDVIASHDAASALARLRAGEIFDVILCDLMMPQMTGMDFHAELLQIDRAQAERVIFWTGGAFSPRARAFLEQVPNLRLDKPFDTLQLRALINDRVR